MSKQGKISYTKQQTYYSLSSNLYFSHMSYVWGILYSQISVQILELQYTSSIWNLTIFVIFGAGTLVFHLFSEGIEMCIISNCIHFAAYYIHVLQPTWSCLTILFSKQHYSLEIERILTHTEMNKTCSPVDLYRKRYLNLWRQGLNYYTMN